MIHKVVLSKRSDSKAQEICFVRLLSTLFESPGVLATTMYMRVLNTTSHHYTTPFRYPLDSFRNSFRFAKNDGIGAMGLGQIPHPYRFTR